MLILPILLTFGTASCVVQKIEQGHTKDGVSEVEQGDVPVGCADQLSFVRENIIEDFSTYIKHRHYLYKYQRECNASVTISHDQEIGSDTITFMDAKNISCGTDLDSSLLLNFPNSKHEKYSRVKFPCDTKEIVIAKIPSWGDIDRLMQESLQEVKSSTDKYYEADKSWWAKFSRQLEYSAFISVFHGMRAIKHLIRGYGVLFSDHYKTFRKKVLGGLAIVYSNHQQATLRNPTGIGIIRKSGTKGYSYGAIGVSKEGSFIYHIKVDKKGKKQMLYPRE